jgi:hypothetical protein
VKLCSLSRLTNDFKLNYQVDIVVTALHSFTKTTNKTRMGGYQSKVPTPTPPQNFSNSESTPARVHFSADLLKQLQYEQELRISQRRVPAAIIPPVEPESAEKERLARIERERQIISQLEQERIALRQAEEEASEKAKLALAKVEKRAKSSTGLGVLNVHNICSEEAKRLTGLLDSKKLDQVFKELDLYEACVRRQKEEIQTKGKTL